MSLDRFSPAVREWFTSTFEAPTAAQAQGWPAIAGGQHTLILAPTGSGKTLAAFLWALDRLMTEPPPAADRRLPGPVRVAVARAGRRRREEPSGAAHRHRPRGRAARRARPRTQGGDPHGRHPGERTPPHPDAPPGHPHHHARVALSDVDVPGAGGPAQRPMGDRRRDPRPRGDQTRGASRPLARTARGDRARVAATGRALGHPAPARGDRAVPRRADRAGPPARHDRGRRPPQADGGGGRRSGRGHDGAHRPRRDPAAHAGDGWSRVARDGSPSRVDLAGDPSPAPRADPGASIHDRVREREAAGRAPLRATERAGRRGAGARPPRLDLAGAAPRRSRTGSSAER